MTPYCSIDANILIRHFMQDHADHSSRSSALIKDIVENRFEVLITDPVVFEVVFVMDRSYGVDRHSIASKLLQVLLLDNVICPGIELFMPAFGHFVRELGLSFVDCHLAVETLMSGIDRVVSFDRKIGRLPGVTRIEPPLNGIE